MDASAQQTAHPVPAKPGWIATILFVMAVGGAPAMTPADVQAVAASIWMSWIIPMIACELALQWKSTSKRITAGNAFDRVILGAVR